MGEGIGRNENDPSKKIEITTAISGVSSEASALHLEGNEDSALMLNGDGIYAVFDGVSKQKISAKEVSSKASEILESIFLGWGLPKKIEDLERILTLTNERLRNSIDSKVEKATTVACAVMVPEEGKILVAHAGDSRVYVFRNGVMECLTLDHSKLYIDIDRAGDMQNLMDRVDENSDKFQIKQFGEYIKTKSSITDWLGRERFKPDVREYEIQAGDKFLICSDGMDNLTTEQMKEIMEKKNPPDQIAQKLVSTARKVSVSHRLRSHEDDITAMVVEVKDYSLRRSDRVIDSGWFIASVEGNMATMNKRLPDGELITKNGIPVSELIELSSNSVINKIRKVLSKLHI